MFIDDDPLILKKLTYILDWEALGFSVVGTANDGISALNQLKTVLPDVIISDINMPNMDGLSLIREIKQYSEHIHFILLTVNDSFGCAQQALNMGVCHYLLKPLEKDDLLELMLRIRTELEHSQRQTLYVSELQEKAVISERMIKDKFLTWVASGRQNLNEKQIQEQFRFYKIPVSGRDFQLISIYMDQQPGTEISSRALLDTVTQCVENTLCDFSNCAVFCDNFYNLNILLGFGEQECSYVQSTPVICQSLRNDLAFTLNLSVTICYSHVYRGYQNIYRCYFETKYLSRHNLDKLHEGILSYDSFMNVTLSQSLNMDFLRQETLKFLRAGETQQLSALVKNTLSADMDYTSYHILRLDFVMTGIMFIQENRLNIRDIFNRHFEPLSEVMSREDPSECISFICGFYQTLLFYVAQNKISSRHSLVEKCAELVSENISNPALSVKWLASQLYVNEDYLSRQFRREYGLPLIKYVSGRRLDLARDYMNQGYTNQQSIAEMCGFHDPLYFSKCFKKRFGIAPSKYAEGCTGHAEGHKSPV